MPLIETSTGPIAYDERGSGPPIFLLPSGGHESSDYDELRTLLAPELRTIAIDWPAHGQSPPGTGAVTAMRLADVAQETVQALAPGGAIVLGNSVGGFAAARMAIRRPDLVRGLVIVDGGGFSSRPAQERSFCALMSRPAFLRAIYPAFARAYMRSRTDADRRALRSAVATTRRDPGLRAVCELWGSFRSPEHDLRADAGSITAPTLVIWGRRDPVIPLSAGRRIAGSIPGAELAALDTGHVPYTTDPDAFAAHLLPFARTALAPAGAGAAWRSGEDRAARGRVREQHAAVLADEPSLLRWRCAGPRARPCPRRARGTPGAERADVADLQIGGRVADAGRKRGVDGASHAGVEDRRGDPPVDAAERVAHPLRRLHREHGAAVLGLRDGEAEQAGDRRRRHPALGYRTHVLEARELEPTAAASAGSAQLKVRVRCASSLTPRPLLERSAPALARAPGARAPRGWRRSRAPRGP